MSKNQAPAKPAPTSQTPGTPQANYTEPKPNAEAVRKRAYELFLERSKKGLPGDPTTDWSQAEKELAAKRG